LADDVIDIALKASLLPRELSQLAFGRPRTLPLEIPTPVCVNPSSLLDGCFSVGGPIRIGCVVDDAELDAEDVACFRGRRFLHVANDVQVEPIPVEEQVDIASAEGQILALVVATRIRDNLPAGNRPDTHLVAGLEAENPVVVGNASVRSEGALDLPVRLICV